MPAPGQICTQVTADNAAALEAAPAAPAAFPAHPDQPGDATQFAIHVGRGTPNDRGDDRPAVRFRASAIAGRGVDLTLCATTRGEDGTVAFSADGEGTWREQKHRPRRAPNRRLSATLDRLRSAVRAAQIGLICAAARAAPGIPQRSERRRCAPRSGRVVAQVPPKGPAAPVRLDATTGMPTDAEHKDTTLIYVISHESEEAAKKELGRFPGRSRLDQSPRRQRGRRQDSSQSPGEGIYDADRLFAGQIARHSAGGNLRAISMDTPAAMKQPVCFSG